MRDTDITVLVADDSALTRKAVRAVLQEAGYRVVGEARNGVEAVDMAVRLRPTVVTMDLEMPERDGLEAIEHIMARAPTRILVLSGEPRFRGGSPTFEAISRGALELLPKPTSFPGTHAEQKRLVDVVRQVADVPVIPHFRMQREARRRARCEQREHRPVVSNTPQRAIVIGASTGGPRVLRAILSALPADFPHPIVAVQHLAETFVSSFVEWLDESSELTVREPTEGDRLEPGVAWVAVRGGHVALGSTGRLDRRAGREGEAHVPGVDVLFASAAAALGAGSVGVLLSGMGRDGAAGLKVIADAGGVTMAQDEESSVVFGMPRAAVELGAVTTTSSIDDIIARLGAYSPCSAAGAG